MIPVQNIYYMLSYAFQALQAQNYKDLATENFHNTAELCAAILDKGISIQLKRGLGRDYVPKSESLSTLQGKLTISESIKTQTLLKKQMICIYDEFSTNTQFNQIIKSTMLLLLKANITNTRKKSLRNLLLFFSDVNEIDLRFVNWNQHYNRSNQSYQMLIGICYLIYNGLLQTQNDGTTKIMDFFDEQHMCRLYEKFLLEYYRKEHPELSANASQIAWQLDDSASQLLPKMQTDIMLSQGNNILITWQSFNHPTILNILNPFPLHLQILNFSLNHLHSLFKVAVSFLLRYCKNLFNFPQLKAHFLVPQDFPELLHIIFIIQTIIFF